MRMLSGFFYFGKMCGNILATSNDEIKMTSKSNKMLKIFSVKFFCLLPFFCLSQIFHDNQGNAILFYNATGNVLYDYSGNCKFYYKGDNFGDVNLFNFNGKHCGWYVNGTLRDHQGRIMASETNKLLNVQYKMPPLKPLEKLTPIKALEELAPMKPLWVDQASSYLILYYTGSSTLALQQPNPNGTKNDYTAVENRKPYALPGSDIAETIEAMNNKHYEMIANGYTYYKGNYYTQEQYSKIVDARKNKIDAFNAEIRRLGNVPIAIRKEEYWIKVKLIEEISYKFVDATLEINEKGECNKIYYNDGTGIFRDGTIITKRAQNFELNKFYIHSLAGLPGGTQKDYEIWVFIEPNAIEFKSKKELRSYYKGN
jgi:hypothetical protein